MAVQRGPAGAVLKKLNAGSVKRKNAKAAGAAG